MYTFDRERITAPCFAGLSNWENINSAGRAVDLKYKEKRSFPFDFSAAKQIKRTTLKDLAIGKTESKWLYCCTNLKVNGFIVV